MEATKCTYDIKDSKQEEYKSKGIEKVKLYLTLKATQWSSHIQYTIILFINSLATLDNIVSLN